VSSSCSAAIGIPIRSSGSSAMTGDRTQEILDRLLTTDGRGARAKGDMLAELLDSVIAGEQPALHDRIALSIAGICIACGRRGHGAALCPTRRR